MILSATVAATVAPTSADWMHPTRMATLAQPGRCHTACQTAKSDSESLFERRHMLGGVVLQGKTAYVGRFHVPPEMSRIRDIWVEGEAGSNHSDSNDLAHSSADPPKVTTCHFYPSSPPASRPKSCGAARFSCHRHRGETLDVERFERNLISRNWFQGIASTPPEYFRHPDSCPVS